MEHVSNVSKKTSALKWKPIRRTVKFLTVCDPRLFKAVIAGSSDGVIKTICNAAYNVEQGDVHLTRRQRRLFAHYRNQIAQLTSPAVPLERKRQTIANSGELIPKLLSVALGQLGGALTSV